MSSFRFNPGRGPIYVRAEATGPAQSLVLKLILDTGATTSLINDAILAMLGFNPAQSGTAATIYTGSSVQ